MKITPIASALAAALILGACWLWPASKPQMDDDMIPEAVRVIHEAMAMRDRADAAEYNFSQRPMSVDWMGCPMVFHDDDSPQQAWMPGVEIGLREDGVVVWRAREKP